LAPLGVDKRKSMHELAPIGMRRDNRPAGLAADRRQARAA
jgi:hypothetical protein